MNEYNRLWLKRDRLTGLICKMSKVALKTSRQGTISLYLQTSKMYHSLYKRLLIWNSFRFLPRYYVSCLRLLIFMMLCSTLNGILHLGRIIDYKWEHEFHRKIKFYKNFVSDQFQKNEIHLQMVTSSLKKCYLLKKRFGISVFANILATEASDQLLHTGYR